MSNGKTRYQDIPPTPYQDSGKNNNVTLGRHTYFGSLWLSTGDGKPKLVGGMQAFSVEENNNTNFRAMAGCDWLEPVFGMREWSGQGSRFMIRGNDLQEILHQKFGSVTDIDFRFLPFTWQFAYNFVSVTGNTDFENMHWAWATVIVTRYRWNFVGPNELVSEDFSFIAKGYTRSHKGGKGQMNNDTSLWGRGVGQTG